MRDQTAGQLRQSITDEMEARGIESNGTLTMRPDMIELRELFLTLYGRDELAALRLHLMAADGVATQVEILRAFRDAVARLPVIH